jgi:ABC-2 type transport system ATP-binding protein
MTPPAIRTTSLSRQFGTVRALDDITLEVPSGIIFGFLGPNGSGKTTMIRMLLGLLEPTTGTAHVLGSDTHTGAAGIRQHCGALLEHCGLYERLSAADNLDLYGRFWRIPWAERRARTKELLTRLDLYERRDEIVGGWSRGMKQQLAIARALYHRPQLVFLDEPTAGLDPIAAVTLRDRLAHLSASEGVTVFLTTHNLAEAERLCSLAGIVNKGRLLAVAPPAQLGARREGTSIEVIGTGLTDAMLEMVATLPAVSSVRRDGRALMVGLTSADGTTQVVAALVSAGFQIETVRNTAGSLEDAFHSLVEAQA